MSEIESGPANATFKRDERVENPRWPVGNRETAYGFPNIQGYEIKLVTTHKAEGEEISKTNLVWSLSVMMAENEYSNTE